MSFIENVKKAQVLRNELQVLLPLSKEDDDKFWQRLRMEWNYNSNHIEGNTLTYGETQLLLMFDTTTGDHKLREYDEMKAHDAAIKLVKEWAEDKTRDLTESEIRQLNKIILVQPYWKEAITYDGKPTQRQIKIGEYKEFANSVRMANGEMFHYSKPEDVPRLMKELMEWYIDSNQTLHPIQIAAELHYRFITIHPFDDGNGRVARLLVNFVLMRNEYPPIVIKSKDKDNYFIALQKADAGNIEPFYNYITQQLILSLELNLKIARGEKMEDPDELDKKISLLEMDLEMVNSDEIVEMQLSKANFLKIFDIWISFLLIKLIEVTQKFNKFFIGDSRHYISIHQTNFNIHVPFADESSEKIVNILREKIIAEPDNVHSQLEFNIHFEAFYGTFKKGGLNTFGCNYGLIIKFDFIKYEIIVDTFGAKERKNSIAIPPRLLHKPLSNEEIENIAADFGETIYKHIDFYTKEKGIRK